MRVAVIGAGIIGLATAAEVRDRGHEVTVFDPEPASGASRAAAGMLAPVTEADWGHDTLHALLREAASLYPGFVEHLQRASGRRLGYRTTATLSVGVDAADREVLVRLAALQTRAGGVVQRLTGSQAREGETALGPGVTIAMRVPEDHQIDPRHVTAALIDVLGDRVRPERVVALEGSADGCRARSIRLTSGEQVDADVVVVATGVAAGRPAGSGAAAIDGIPAVPVRPVWGDILRLRVPEHLRPLLTHTVRAQVHGRAVYLVPREDGTLVLGASVREGGVEGVQAGEVLALLRDARAVVPGIDECEIVEMLARPRPGSPDAIPMLGLIAPGLLLSTGYDRHGVLLAPLAARLAADLIDGRPLSPALAASLDPHRFDAVEPATRQRESR